MDLSGLNLGAVEAAVEAAASRGLGLAAEYILSEATKIVPIEEGALQNSGRTEVEGLTAVIGFGSGPSAAYAVRQHEDLSYKHDEGRSAHYLSGPMAENTQVVQRIVGDAIAGIL